MSSSEQSGTDRHYARLATRYDHNWEHSASFVDWMTERIIEMLDAQPGDTIVDVGGGTGIYASRLLDRLGGGTSVWCVDPSEAMLRQAPAARGLRTIVATAGAVPDRLADEGVDAVDRVLVKEAVHHFDDLHEDTGRLARLLGDGGSMAVVMLPPEIEYPLFSRALARFEELQPHFGAVQDALSDAGLVVAVTEASFDLEFPVDRYLEMVRERYMSLLSEFDDDELEAGLAEMNACRPAEDVYRFPDRFIFVTGRRGD